MIASRNATQTVLTGATSISFGTDRSGAHAVAQQLGRGGCTGNVVRRRGFFGKPDTYRLDVVVPAGAQIVVSR